MTHTPDIPWKRVAIAAELKIPAQRPRPPTLSIAEMAAVLDDLQTEHLFRFAIISLCTWARPQAVLDLHPPTQVDWNDGSLDLAPVGWIATKKRRPRQPLSCGLAGWLRGLGQGGPEGAGSRARGGDTRSGTRTGSAQGRACRHREEGDPAIRTARRAHRFLAIQLSALHG